MHLLLCLLTAVAPQDTGDDRSTLWQIGEPDGDTSELALGPGGYREYEHEAIFVAGQSRAEADWPYVHPGPVDAWAGGRSHTFAVWFGLREPIPDGRYRLVVELVDTQKPHPPRLGVSLNGEAIAEYDTPPGASDSSIEGDPSAGSPHRFEVEIEAAALRAENRLEITTLSGCWVLYDSLRFEAPQGAELVRVGEGCLLRGAVAQSCLVEREGRLTQPIALDVLRLGEACRAECRANGELLEVVELVPGNQTLRVHAPAVRETTPCRVELRVRGEALLEAEVVLEPVRQWVLYLMHHTHLDIGYTHTQEEVEQRQMQFLDRVLELIRETDDYPPEARFTWLPEGLWAVESWLKAASEEKRAAFVEAARTDRIGLDALYGNALTGLYSQEELYELVDYALRLRREFGIPIDSAMISDVPGYTWGLVPVLATSGIRYLSAGPNTGHRIGHTRIWGDRPFWWVSPCGRHEVLFWMAGQGYAWFHAGSHTLNRRRLFGYLEQLERDGYPYDMVQLRYNIGGDNGPPDEGLSDFVREWNEEYAWPKMILCTTSRMFRDFEERYGDGLPVVRGDFTPYWEDGAASTAADTAACRSAAEMLVQARTLWALLAPRPCPDGSFYDAWRNAVLYDEHTWGAYNSISRPDHPFAKRQVEYKQQFALFAEMIARSLTERVLRERMSPKPPLQALEVLNTHSWPVTDLVVVPKVAYRIELGPGDATKRASDLVTTSDGVAVPSQRLSDGSLVFVASEVPPLGSIRFEVHPGEAPRMGSVRAGDASLESDRLKVVLDPESGSIAELRLTGLEANLVDGGTDRLVNDYVYVAGRDPSNQQMAGKASIEVLDAGPLVGTLQVSGEAPGTQGLVRRIRIVDGLDRVDIENLVDKLPIREKEGVHFAFPFNVPGATVRMDMPWCVIRPEADQIPGACKTFYAVQRWVDASNLDWGVTLVTLDAPMVQMGEIRTDVPAPWGPEGWLERAEPSATFYSYVMNNYWETNYKADQEGQVRFRYSLRPHAGVYDQIEVMRLGLEQHQGLIVIPVSAEGPPALSPAFRLSSRGVILSSLRPSEDGEAWIARLFAASGRPERVELIWPEGRERAVYESDPDQTRGRRLEGPLELPAYGIATLRIEREGR